MRRTGPRLSAVGEHAARLRSALPAGAFRTVLVSWLAARFVVTGAYALTRYFTHAGNATSGGTPFQHLGLLGWDAAFYRDLARVGYGGMPVEARRFSPLLPLIVRV